MAAAGLAAAAVPGDFSNIFELKERVKMFRLCLFDRVKTGCVRNLLRVLVVLALVLLPTELFAISVVPQTSVFYVNDAAELLSEETEQYIVSINDKLRAASGAQVVVVTVPDMGGASLEEYATALFRTYGIGDAKKNNGVLMLLALKERQSRIEVGYGLEGVLTDGKTGGIQDKYMIPYYKEGKWGEGVVNGFNAIIDEIKAEYGVVVENAEPKAVASAKASSDDTGSLKGLIIIALFILGLFGGVKIFESDSRNRYLLIFLIVFICFCIAAYLLNDCEDSLGKIWGWSLYDFICVGVGVPCIGMLLGVLKGAISEGPVSGGSSGS